MPESQDSERAPLIAQESSGERLVDGDSHYGIVRQWIIIVAACGGYIAMSSCLINYNKFLMHEDKFPYAVPLSAMHMVVSCSLCFVVYAICSLLGTTKSVFPGVALVQEDPSSFIRKLLPLSVFFAASICCSNQAYMYCSVPFLQMCKEMNIVMIYAFSLLLGVETYNGRVLSILLVVFMGCAMSVHGEMTFSAKGFTFQAVSQVAEVLKILIQQMMMQGLKIDPLTMVMVMSPLCLCTLALGMYFFWVPGILEHAQAHWGHLLLNGCNAFALNVCVAIVIRTASGVSFVLAGVIKDVAIVVAATMLFGAHIGVSQGVGFAIAVTGVAVHSLNKMQAHKQDAISSPKEKSAV
jgi:hypothetical protein